MTKKILRFMCALAIVLTLVLVSSGTAWAKDTAQLDYADIASRVPKHNATLDVLQRRLPLAVKSREQMEQAEQFSKSAGDAASNLSGVYSGILTDPSSGAEQKAWATLMLNSLAVTQMSGGSFNFDAVDQGIAQLRIAIPQTQAQMISGGQQLFMSYHKLQDDMAKLKANRPLLEEQISLAQTQLKAGLGTELAVKQAQLSLAELDTGLLQMESGSAQMLSQLKLLVGWPQEQIIKLGDIPRPNREFLPKLKLADDIKTAQTNSYSIQLKQVEIRYASDDDKKLAELEIVAQKESIAAALSTQYYKITDANNTLLLEEQRLVVAEEKVKQARLQHQLGLLSELALNAEETTYNSQRDAVTSAMNTLFGEIENYKTIVAGLN